jgi:hypothetical protein
VLDIVTFITGVLATIHCSPSTCTSTTSWLSTSSSHSTLFPNVLFPIHWRGTVIHIQPLLRQMNIPRQPTVTFPPLQHRPLTQPHLLLLPQRTAISAEKQLATLVGPTDGPSLTDNAHGDKTLHFRTGKLISSSDTSPFPVYATSGPTSAASNLDSVILSRIRSCFPMGLYVQSSREDMFINCRPRGMRKREWMFM